MIIKIAVYNIYILLFLITLLLGVLIILLIKDKIKEFFIERISERIFAKYEELSRDEFREWAGNLKIYNNLMDEKISSWLQNPDTDEMAELIVEELNLEEKWQKRAREGLWWTRALYSRRLALIGTEASIPILLDNLSHKNSDIFYNSALSLIKIGGKGVYNTVVNRVLNAEWLSISRAIDLLSKFADPPINTFREKFADASQREQQIILGTAVKSSDKQPFTGLIIESFNNQEKELRLRAIKTAKYFDSEKIKENLLAFLKSPIWEERALAAKSLAQFSGKDVLEGLSRSILDENWWVRNNSAWSLARQGEEGIYYLSRVLMSDNQQAKDIAYHYLNSDQNIFLTLKEKPLTESQKITDYKLAEEINTGIY